MGGERRGRTLIGSAIKIIHMDIEATALKLFLRYINALLDGNPFVLVPTIIAAVALAMGPFHEALSRKDPAAIGIAAFVILGVVVLLALAIVDRRLNPPEGKRRKSGRPKPRR